MNGRNVLANAVLISREGRCGFGSAVAADLAQRCFCAWPAPLSQEAAATERPPWPLAEAEGDPDRPTLAHWV